jgi:hypothetical protein
MSLDLKYLLFQDGNHKKRARYQLQQVDGKGERFLWSHQVGLQVCLELMHILFEHTPLHEQGPMRGVIMLIEVG